MDAHRRVGGRGRAGRNGVSGVVEKVEGQVAVGDTCKCPKDHPLPAGVVESAEEVVAMVVEIGTASGSGSNHWARTEPTLAVGTGTAGPR